MRGSVVVDRDGRQQLIAREDDEQITVAQWLDLYGICFMHSPNEGDRHVAYKTKLTEMGMQRGFPDLLIMDVPPSLPDKKGAAIEMKTRSPGAKVSPDQEKWLARLEARGWVCRVCWGADEAIAWLQSLGYGRATRGGRRNGRYTD